MWYKYQKLIAESLQFSRSKPPCNWNMNRFIQLISVLTVCVTSSYQQAGCWWSGCQPKNWAQRGCFPTDKLEKKRSEGCAGGDKYYCCPKSGGGGGGGGNPPGGGGGGVYYNDI